MAPLAAAQTPAPVWDKWEHVGIELNGVGPRDFGFTVGDGRDVFIDRIEVTVSAQMSPGARSPGGPAQALIGVYSPSAAPIPGHILRPPASDENFEVDHSYGAVNVKVVPGESVHLPVTWDYSNVGGTPATGGEIHARIDTTQVDVPIDVEVHMQIHWRYQ